MKPIFRKTILIALALSVAACSSTPVRRSMKETWNDSLTASKIRYKMMRDSEVKKSRMHVEVYRGQVTLTGRSMTDTEKTRAETLAKSVKRVTGVENYVHVVGGSDTAVAKAPIKGVPLVAVSPKAGVAPSSVIQEKSIIAAKSTVAEDDAPATLATIRESTGKPAAAPVVASHKAVDSKVAKVKSTKPEPKLAAARKAKAPVTTAKAKAPVAAPVSAPAVVPSAIKEVAPVATQSTIPAAKVVGQSKTGLPWDGEIYADDATRVASPAKPVLATRTPAATSAPAPTVTPAATSGDDLAREAAQELEKLRLKK